MKSKEAKEFIDKTVDVYGSYMPDNEKGGLHLVLERIVDMAEKDAEQRVRLQAVEAFKSSCRYKDGCAAAGRECDPALCEDLRLFIEKLREDETNES